MKRPTIRLRIVLDNGKAIGPGKADLLTAIEQHGSIAAAGRSMGMSYQRAWSLVDELNAMFRRPLVTALRGGTRGGGAALTETGRQVLGRYRTLERTANVNGRAELLAIERLAERVPSISTLQDNA